MGRPICEVLCLILCCFCRTLFSPNAYPVVLDIAGKVAADLKAALTSKYRAPPAAWLARTALEVCLCVCVVRACIEMY